MRTTWNKYVPCPPTDWKIPVCDQVNRSRGKEISCLLRRNYVRHVKYRRIVIDTQVLHYYTDISYPFRSTFQDDGGNENVVRPDRGLDRKNDCLACERRTSSFQRNVTEIDRFLKTKPAEKKALPSLGRMPELSVNQCFILRSV